MIFDFQRLQDEQSEWSNYNFGYQPPHRGLLGIVEEVGELSHAHLKAEQGIRGTPEELAAERDDAIGDIVIYLAEYCNRNCVNFQKAVEDAWNHTKQRDWKRYPRNGKTE